MTIHAPKVRKWGHVPTCAVPGHPWYVSRQIGEAPGNAEYLLGDGSWSDEVWTPGATVHGYYPTEEAASEMLSKAN